MGLWKGRILHSFILLFVNFSKDVHALFKHFKKLALLLILKGQKEDFEIITKCIPG